MTPDSDKPASENAGLSIVDLIIQEQMEKDALVLAPKTEKREPEPEPVKEIAKQEPEPEPEPVEEEATEPEPVPEPVEEVAQQEQESEPSTQPVEEIAEREPEPEPEPVEEETTEPEPEPVQEVAQQEPEPEPALEDVSVQSVVEAALSGDPLAETLFLGPSSQSEPDEDLFKTRPLEQPTEPTLEEVSSQPPAEPQQPTQPLQQPLESVPPTPPPEPASPLRPAETAQLPSVQEPVLVQQAQKPAKPSSPITRELQEVAQSSIETPERTPKPSKPSSSVGGKLRDLEQALSQSGEGKLPWGFKKRALASITMLAKLSGIQRGLVMVEDSQGELRSAAKAGVDGEDYIDQFPLHIMKSVLRSNEPLLMLDTTRDPRLMKDEKLQSQGIISGLCVPFSDCVSSARGVLYADNLERDNAFTHGDLRDIREFSKRLSTDIHLEEFLPPPQAKAPEKLETESLPFDPRILLAILCASILLVWPSLSNPPKPEPKPVVKKVKVTRVTTDPKIVVLSFLRALETRNYRSAYNYLSEEQQKKVELEKFGEQVKKFAATGNNSWLLAGLSVIDGSTHSGTVKNYKLIRSDGEPISWQVTLTKSQDSWYVSGTKGMGVLSL